MVTSSRCYHDAIGQKSRNVTSGTVSIWGSHSVRYLTPEVHPIDATAGRALNSRIHGNAVLINGKLPPRLDVQPRKYRFRVLNAPNSRFFLTVGGPLAIHQIGSDEGLLPAPVSVGQLVLPPGERADVVVDFSQHRGEEILLHDLTAQLMRFRDGKRWHEPVSEKPVLGTTEIWDLLNLTDDTHPIHLHLVRFQILDRRPIHVENYIYDKKITYTGDAAPPDPNEAGWKDTARATPGTSTRIIVKFDGYPGRYVWHCHILEHEDNEMMRPYEIVRG